MLAVTSLLLLTQTVNSSAQTSSSIVVKPGSHREATAYQQSIRAFGSPSVGFDSYQNAIRQRDAMAPAVLGGGNPGGSKAHFLSAATPAAVTPPFASGKWQFLGPNNCAVAPQIIYFGSPNSRIGGRVNGVAYDATKSGTIYLAADGGGVWKTTNSGISWLPLTDTAFPLLDTSSVAVDPTNGNKVYVGTGDYDGANYGSGSRNAIGIMKSTDGGITWANSTTPNPSPLAGAPVGRIVVDPRNPQIIVAVTGRGNVGGSIWRSTDGGSTFTVAVDATGKAVPKGNWSDLKIGIPSQSGIQLYYAALEGDAVYSSADQGATWKRLGLPNPAFNSVLGLGEYALKVAPSQTDPQTVYLLDASSVFNDGRIFKSTDAGTTWVDITGNFATFDAGSTWYQAEYDAQLTSSTSLINGIATDVLYGQGVNIAGSFGTSQWTNIGFAWQGPPLTQIHTDQHSLAVNPFNPNQTIVANDGGVYGLTFTPSTQSWAFGSGLRLNNTLGATEFYAADWHPTNPDYMLGGTQDNSTPISQGDLVNWGNVGAGDGTAAAINQRNPLFQYTSSQNLGVIGTTDGWVNSRFSFTPIVNNKRYDGDPTPFVGSVVIDPVQSNYVYVGTNYLWRWDQNTSQWKEHVGGKQVVGGTGATVKAIAVAPSNDTVVYASSTDGQLWMLTNALDATDSNVVFTQLDKVAIGLPGRVITHIDVNPTDPYDILVTLSGFGGPHVFRCAKTSNALTPGNPVRFTNQSGFAPYPANQRLPDVPANDITRDPNDPFNTFYVATDIGVFSTTNAGSTWQNATAPLGLPNVTCSAIRAVPATGYLNVATYGRGMWRIPLVDPGPTTFNYSLAFSRNNTINVAITLKNTGRIATLAQINTASLTVGNTTTPSTTTFPVSLGTIPTNQSATGTVSFPATAGRSGSTVFLNLSGTFGGGRFTTSLRTRLP